MDRDNRNNLKNTKISELYDRWKFPTNFSGDKCSFLLSLISEAPSSSSAPTTCQDTPGWYDNIMGYDCSWYEVMDDPGCPKVGNDHGGDMGVPNDNCCYCGGGSEQQQQANR